MKTVVGISLGAGEQDFAFRVRFLGQRCDVRRIGTNGSVATARKLLRQWSREADAIGLGIAKDSYTVGTRRFVERDSARLTSVVTRIPVTTGGRLGDILQEWALRHVQTRLGDYFNNARVLFFSGTGSYKLAQAMSEYTQNLEFADPLLQFGVPKMLTSLEALELYASGAHYVADWTPSGVLSSLPLREWTKLVLRYAMRDATVIVAPVHELDRFGAEELAGKTIVTSTVNDRRVAEFRRKGVHMVVDGAPMLFGRVLGPSLLDAMIVAATGKAPDDILEDDYLEIITSLGLEPRILYPNGFRRVNRFAFVIHPLSQEYFKNVKPIELLSQVSPPVLMDTLEKVMAYAPPFVYSKVSGIRSPTGVEAEGWLISVGGTPKEIMRHGPEFTYRRLLDAARMAKGLGAQIMGLGAFTKVVGDAGLTVARRAPLPITTGNSYSASGALWAAHDAMLRMGLVPAPKRGDKVRFKAMVVGATGAIGSVCARMLAMVAEELYMVSPETAKLLALKESILKEAPDAKLFLSSRADKDIADMDMIVTATSGAGKRILDIMKVKPGCVITDVARPLDLPPEEVAKRPDVLVIESGEIQLPGRVAMRNIGLPKNVAYACLAETIVLALEGRFENFTVGRNIEWEKVREIYRLGRKHGMQLAAISGVNGPFSDADIARVRKLALAARARSAAGAFAATAAVALVATAVTVAPAAWAQGPGVPGAEPRPRAPLVESASPIPREVMDANTAYADCVRRRQGEVQRHALAAEVRDLVDHRERYAADLRANPQVATKYPGGVDQMIDDAYRRYRAAGGTAATPQAVQPGEPPCARPVPAQAPERARRALQSRPAPLEAAQAQLEQCTVRNAPAYQLHRASINVVGAVRRRDELRQTGERLDWSGASRENFRGAERIVEDSFARYRSLGGTAATAEQVTRTDDPCRDEGEQLGNIVRHVYVPGASPVTQTRSTPAPPGGAGMSAPLGSAGAAAPSGSVPVPPPRVPPQ